MKYFTLTLLLIATLVAGVVSYDARALFGNAAQWDTSVSGWVVQTSATQADTLESNEVRVSQSDGAIAFDLGYTNVSGTPSVKVLVGIFVGAGAGNNGGEYYFTEIATITASGQYHYNLADYTFGSRPYQKLKIKLEENGVQESKFYPWLHTTSY